VGEFDFWVGDWTCAWDGGGGTNTVTSECGGVVILERFESAELQGRSLSVRSAADGVWRQAWADSSGTYLDFEGGPAAGGMELRGGDRRMRWVDVEHAGLTWLWEQLQDDDWAVLWRIEYTRA
jgi:hypothetical protein